MFLKVNFETMDDEKTVLLAEPPPGVGSWGLQT